MRSILLYANEDAWTLQRLEAALRIATTCDSHVHCLQLTSADEYVFADSFGGVYPMLDLLRDVRAQEEAFQQQIEARLSREGARWTWINEARVPSGAPLKRLNLIDLSIVSLVNEPETSGSTPAPARLAMQSDTPILAILPHGRPFDTRGDVMVAWNGSPEAARALRAAVPLIRFASSVTIVEVIEHRGQRSAIDAAEYLGYHDIKAEVREHLIDQEAVADALRRAAIETAASYIVMGAYGKSRLRERVLGGVTASLTKDSPCSLLMSH
ncbi:universal stress protein [Sphingomonas sp. IC-56]|uniref:universal stress protein n=1 Tax=Sphingomonas sp. IC-56 TaxID=2898529 RepID=UPI001E2DAE3E|nr:universal stress protein [Sphingomonas sp. IC-56]